MKSLHTSALMMKMKKMMSYLPRNLFHRGPGILLHQVKVYKAYILTCFHPYTFPYRLSSEIICSFCSKNSVAMFLPLQHKLDPGVIFPLESFCNMDEGMLELNIGGWSICKQTYQFLTFFFFLYHLVLLPRKLQQSQIVDWLQPPSGILLIHFDWGFLYWKGFSLTFFTSYSYQHIQFNNMGP